MECKLDPYNDNCDPKASYLDCGCPECQYFASMTDEQRERYEEARDAAYDPELD